MAINFFGKKSRDKLAAFTGFEQVFPVLNPGGTERFGVIEILPETNHGIPGLLGFGKRREPTFTGVLQLSGPTLNLWLASGKTSQSFYESLTRNLPLDTPAQFLLRRRNLRLENHYNALQEKINQRIADEEVADFFLQEYLDNLVYPVEASGLGEIWFGLLVSANNLEALTGIMAVLVASLPCEVTPCSSAEIAKLVLDYYAPLLLETHRNSGQPIPNELFPAMLAEAGLNVQPDSVHNGLATAYWRVSAPPLSHPQGWTLPLLSNSSLVYSEFDIAIHLTPASRDDKLVEVLQRRLAFLDEQLETAFTRQDTAIIDDLQEQRAATFARYEAVLNKDNRYFEAGITLALHSEETELEAACHVFESELKECGLAARRTLHASETRSAMHEVAPLNLPQSERPLVLPAGEAGQLVHLAPVVSPPGKAGQTLAGLSLVNEPVYLDPTSKSGDSALFLLGENGKATTHQARTFLRYQAIMDWLKGETVCGLDRKGEWEDLVLQFGGNFVKLGPDESEFNFNPLEVNAENLKWDNTLSDWLTETAAFLSDLLKLEDELQQDLLAVLFEAAMALVNRNEPVNAASIWMRSESGGYGLLSLMLKELTRNGRFGWLCARPTRLPQPGISGDLLFIGLSPAFQSLLTESQQKFYFARFFTTFANQLWSANPSALRPRLLILDQAQEFLNDPISARTLGWLEQRSKPAGLKIWLASPTPADWLNSFYGRNLFDGARCHLIFQQSQNSMAPVARRLGLSQNMVKAVREARPGAAFVRQIDENGQVQYFGFGPLPGDYFERYALASGRLTTPTANQARRVEAEEVPLFAPDEIWDEGDLPEYEPQEEIIEVAAISLDETSLAIIA